MSLLIAESGATKTDWAWIRQEGVSYYQSEGIHPLYLKGGAAGDSLRRKLSGVQAGRLIFYGTGAISDAWTGPVRELLHASLNLTEITFHDDLTAIAHAFPEHEGIAGILGSGSASGWFTGGEIRYRVAALGYILGDEGSGADIGKRLLRAYYRGDLGEEARHWLEARTGPFDYGETIQILHTTERPSFWLANLAGKVLKEKKIPPEMNHLMDAAMDSYIEAHLVRYEGFPETKIVLTGGVAVRLARLLSRQLAARGVHDLLIVEDLIVRLAERYRSGDEPSNG